MAESNFYNTPSAQSKVKAEIIHKYFFAWAKVVKSTTNDYLSGKIAYIDLYAGPGRYADGTPSTPILILQTAIGKSDISEMLVSYFNDAEEATSLEDEINKLPGIEDLKYPPNISKVEVNDKFVQCLINKTRYIPTFCFIDPFGYKGLSQNIIKNVINNWGCECIFFFNYNRINAAITNKGVASHIDKLFSTERAKMLRVKLQDLDPDQRRKTIVEELEQEIRRHGGKYILTFTFQHEHKNRTSHMLIFVSKHFRGYEIMKDILAKASSTGEDVPSYKYLPKQPSILPLFPHSLDLLDQLKKSLRDTFAGQEEMTFDQLYEKHSVDTPYIRKNYRTVLDELEAEGFINVRSTLTEHKRRAKTYPEHVLIRFLE